MTINTATITSGPYTGNGVTTDFSYTFRVENKNQLTVFETTAMGVQSTLTVDTDYTVNNVGTDGGGTITRVAGALPSGYTWYIRSNYNTLQETDFESQGAFYPAVHEAAFDKITFLIQQLYDLNTRSFRLSDSDPDGGVVDLSLPTIANRANRVLIFDENGDLGVGSSIGTIRGNWVTGTQYFVRDLYIDESTSNVYFVETNHVATSIAADLAAGYVSLLIDAEIVTTKAAEAVASASAASSSEIAAAASEALAEKWAEEDEDVEVEPGLYSAKHYAIKAEDAFATGAAGSVSYDNATSGLTATDVQDAIDELEGEKLDNTLVSQVTAEEGSNNDPVAFSALRVRQSILALRATSSGYTLTSGGLITWAHGLGSKPFSISGYIKCLVAQGGYSIGDEVEVAIVNNSDAADTRPHGVWSDSTNVYFRTSSRASAFVIGNKSDGSVTVITNDRWELYLRASL